MDTGLLRTIISKHFDDLALRRKLPSIDYRDENVFQNLYFFFLNTIEENDFPLLTEKCRQAKNDLEKYYSKQCVEICRSLYSKLHAQKDEKTKLIEAKMKGDKENMKDKVMITELNEEIVELKEKVTEYKEMNRNLNDKLFTKNSIDEERARIILKHELKELKDKTEKLENENCKYKKQLEQCKRSSSASSLDMSRSLVSNESSSTMNIENNNNISSAAGGCLCNCPSYLHHIQKISEKKNINQEILDFINIYNEFEDYSINLYKILMRLQI